MTWCGLCIIPDHKFGPRGTPQPPPITGIVRREEIPFRSETCSPQSDHNNVPLSPYSPSFIHGITAYKIVGNFFGLSYRKISGSNQVKNVFIRTSNISVPCPHAQLRGRTVITDIFRTLGSGSLSVTAMLDFSGKANTSIHGLGEDDTASRQLPCKAKRQYLLTLQVSRYCLLALQDSIGEHWTAI